MLKSCLSHSIPRSLGVPTRVACLHTSTPILAQAGGSTASRKRNPLALKKENRQLKAERAERDAARKPHVILGTVPGDTTSWPKSDLAQILVDLKPSDAKETADPAELDTALGPLQLPPALRFGVTDREQTLLLETLPSLSTELGTDDILSQSSSDHAPSYTYGGFFSELETKTPREARLNKEKMSAQSAEDEARRYAAELEAGKKELQKAQMFTTLLDLRNSDAQGLAFENRRRIVQEFSGPENPFDTGRPEVQAALLTYKIRNLWTHLTTFKKDVGNRRALRKLVHQRAKILKYLRRIDRYRYDSVLARLALAPESVEGELVV